MSITIGPVHIADEHGTHEPGAVIDEPSDALIALADAKTLHPDTGQPYVSHSAPVTSPLAVKATAKPDPEVG